MMESLTLLKNNLTAETTEVNINSSCSIPADCNRPVSLTYLLITLSVIVQVGSLPLNVYVLWLIISNARNGIASEFFSINLCVCEIILFVNVIISLINFVIFGNYPKTFFYILMTILSFNHSISRPFFQCCVCVERYVAVIHPVIFLKYKPLRYRIACSVVAWIIILGFSVCCNFLKLRNSLYYILLPEYLLVFTLKICCSVAVLKALRKPGPGEKLSAKDAESNRMKKKAFWVIVIILAFMFITYCPIIMLIVMLDSLSDTQTVTCLTVLFYFVIFAGIVHPFLYLHRAGKLFISGLRFSSNDQK